MFDDENWPPQFEVEPEDLAFAALGIPPTVGLTAMTRAGRLGTTLPAELGASAATLPRSITSDIRPGGLPLRFFEGEEQNAVANSVASGAIIAGLDQTAAYAQNALPAIQQRNQEFWHNRNISPASEVTVRRGAPPQLPSGLNPLTVAAIATTVTALQLLGDRACESLDCNPAPTDTNNNRYYLEAGQDALATGLGVFSPIFGENYLRQRSTAIAAGAAPPRVRNVAAQTALAFGLPAVQSFGATILTEEPPNTSEPIHRGSRAVIQAVDEDVKEVGDTLFGDAREADGNNRNATRAIGNAGAAVATPVLDALGTPSRTCSTTWVTPTTASRPSAPWCRPFAPRQGAQDRDYTG